MENETRKHIALVGKYLSLFAIELMKRSVSHDASKLEDPEKSIFEEFTPMLKGMTYGSEEYKSCLAKMKPALDHHYANNKHHPEYNDINGYSFQTLNDPIRSMDLVDVVEMLCDWIAASKRHSDGTVEKSISISSKRFNIDEQLVALFRNTAAILEQKIEDGE